MAATQDRTLSLYTTLLTALPDILILVRDQHISSLSPGDAGWLNADSARGIPFTELFAGETRDEVSMSLAAAIEHPGIAVRCELCISPQADIAWAELGLQKPVIYDCRLLAVDADEQICLLRDITALRQLEKRASAAVMRDPLTGLNSHRALLTVLEQVIGQSLRFEYNLSLLLIDIDHFSAINERHGWDGGDKVLQTVGTALLDAKRSSDFLCRYGEDRFAVLLSETSAEQAIGAARHLQQVCAELSLMLDGQPVNLTTSVGIASDTAGRSDARTLLLQAEENLLIAISSGGNRVISPLDS